MPAPTAKDPARRQTTAHQIPSIPNFFSAPLEAWTAVVDPFPATVPVPVALAVRGLLVVLDAALENMVVGGPD